MVTGCVSLWGFSAVATDGGRPRSAFETAKEPAPSVGGVGGASVDGKGPGDQGTVKDRPHRKGKGQKHGKGKKMPHPSGGRKKGAGAVPAPAAPLEVKSTHVDTLGPDHPFVLAMKDAYGKNPSLKAALEAHHLSAENVNAANAGWRPNIGMSGSAGYAYTDDQFSDKKSSTNPKTATLSVSQNLFQGGRTVSGVKAAEFDVLAKRADFNATEQQVLIDAVSAYLTVWSADRRLAHVRRSKAFFEETYTQAKARLEVGELSLTDVSQAEFSYRKSLADEVSAAAALANARSNYLAVVGVNPPETLMLPPAIGGLVTLPATLDDLLALAEQSNPQILSAHFSYQQARENINGAYGSFAPSVDVQGNATRSLQSGDRRARSNGLSATVQVSVPLYQRGSEWSTLRGSYHQANQLKYRKNQARNTVVNNGTAAWHQYHTALSQVGFYQAQVAAGEVRIEGTTEQMLVGELTLLDVLNAESAVTQARIDLDNARANAELFGYQLLFAIGQLTSTCLQLPVQVHDTVGYARDARNRLFGLGGATLK